MSIMIDSVTIIRRTAIKTGNPNYLAGQLDLRNKEEEVVAVVDEPYILTKGDDRRDIMLKIAAAVHKGSNYDNKALDRLITEMQDAINILKNELPFN